VIVPEMITRGKVRDPGSAVQVRPLPYPYPAMRAVCSDLDETPDWHIYWEIMRLLSGAKTMAMVNGVAKVRDG